MDRRLDQLDDLLGEHYSGAHLIGPAATRQEWLDQVASGWFIYNAIDEVTTAVRASSAGATTVSIADYDVTFDGNPSRRRLRSAIDWDLVDGRWKANLAAAIPV